MARHRSRGAAFASLALFLVAPSALGAQEAPAAISAPKTTAPTAPTATSEAATKPVPASFRGYTLGMSEDDLKKTLEADELFVFRGDRDVSLLPASDQVLIETTGLSFIRRAFFQLRDGKLFMMAFSLDTERVDHYSVFEALVADYGDPLELDPREAVWLSDTVRLSIERPLTVKYIDRPVFDALSRDAAVKKSREAVLREDFLDAF